MMIDEILMLPLSMQCSGFIGSLLLGAALSLAFAVLKATRKVFFPGVFITAAEDILYCIFASAASFVFLMKFSYGRLRWYIFAGILLGWVIFKLTVGDIISAVLSRLLLLVFGIVKLLLKMIFIPIKAISGFISGKICFLAEKLDKFIKKVCSKCKFCLKKYRLSLYNFLYTAFYPNGNKKGKGCERRGKKKKAQKQLFR